ncbi:Beta-1,3-glucanase [Actinacidiphila rubida]|uniref:Beta-1,3-glucanase n=1 Tax=Actinacidiphila rubida TaxID=310780 RepID=A0A1H8SMN1_9ACTN|nr:Beta-1,3-glucanase [Actinacidiphila rubida]
MRQPPPPTHARSRPRARRGLVAVLSATALILAGLFGLATLPGKAAADASDYTQSAVATSQSQALISFTPATASQYVDVHYLVNGAGQQNFRMTQSGGTWTRTVDQLTTGTVLTYWFTYEKNGPQYDTPQFTYTQGSAGTSTTGGTTGTTTGGGGGGAVPDTIPLTLTNNSGRGDAVYVYDLGTQLSSGQQGWADAGGGFHAWPAGGNPPTPAPDASITGPAPGQTVTIRIPKFSGRVYFSYGQKLVFKLATGGLVQPAVQNPSDPNRNILFNWSEYTLNDSGLWINSTQVDMFSAPYAVGIQSPSGTQTTGHLKSGGYQAVLNALRAQPGGWGGLIQTAPDGSVLRALAPGHGIETGALSTTVLDDYINRVWQQYATSTLTVTPFADQPGTRYFGHVSGNTMNFTDPSGAVVTSFQKPDADSIFGCYKLLDAPNDLVRGPISRTLCAAFNRSTLVANPNQPDTSDSGFYQDAVTNQYARAIHAQMADGRAYAFAFDDVGNHESLVHDGSPQQASITLDPFS